jgi:hypothetical protein
MNGALVAAAAERPRAIATPAARGLLVVTIDRLPAWILPTYGATWVAAPAIDALAAAGVTFDRAIVTDAEPRRVVFDLAGGEGVSSLFAAARARGWRAALVTDDPAVAPAAEGIHRIVVEPRAADTAAEDAAATNLGRLCAAAANVLRAGDHELVWCHAGSLGRVWDAPQEFREAYLDPDDPAPASGVGVPEVVVTRATDPDLVMGIRQVFAGQVTLLDRCLEPLLRAVSPPAAETSAGGASGWAVMIAGVRGLPLGIHGRVGTGPAPPHGEVVHVPAIIVEPRRAMAAQRYGGLVTPADLGRTLVALVAAVDEPPPACPREGRSLMGLFHGWSASARDRVIVTSPEGTAVVTPAWHFVLPARPNEEGRRRGSLFAKPDDYFELCDVADRCPEVAEELRRLAEAAEAGDGERAWQAPLTAAANPPA